MKHTYIISGMSCMGCQGSVERALGNLKEIEKLDIDLKTGKADISMSAHIPLKKLQDTLQHAGLHYTIALPSTETAMTHDLSQFISQPEIPSRLSAGSGQAQYTKKKPAKGNGIFYCPMHCEGDKTYDKAGDCPVCGMDLVEQPALQVFQQYTCPMHPEVIKDGPGDCPICGMDLIPIAPTETAEEKNYKSLWHKMKIALFFTIPVFVIAMSDMIPGNPLAKIMSHQRWNWVQLLLTLPVVFYSGWMFFERAWKSIVSWNLNMFTLIGIGTSVAFLFSVGGLLFPSAFPQEFQTESGSVMLYFEATAVILTLVLLGQLLEARAHSQTSGAIKALLTLAPTEAIRLENGVEKVISINDIEVGDVLRLKPGDKIPVDGRIREGQSSIDESMISGEPIPVDKKEGDLIHAGTLNGNKTLLMVAEKVGADTLLSQIIQMVSEASRSRAPIQKTADTIAKYFVPAVVLISILTFVGWWAFGPEPALVYAFVNAIAVLIIACPCALGLATPMSIMVGVGKGAQSGILIKNAEALETMNKVDVLIIDKTGTITEGKPSVDHVFANNDTTSADLLRKAASLNQYSEHPLAAAVVRYAVANNLKLSAATDFENLAGKGVLGKTEGEQVAVGNQKLMAQIGAVIPAALAEKVATEQRLGKTNSYIAIDKKVLGYLAISDAVKSSSKAAIQDLRRLGLEVIMLTGDNKYTSQAVANSLELSSFEADCLPEDKLNRVKALQQQGKVVAVAGDGINDSPALAQADVGIAMGTGTDVAIESAAITLVKGDLQGIVKAKQLSAAVMRNIRQNLFFAFFYNALGIPIAAGLLYPFFGILLSPMIAAVAMSFSSVSVIGNALRLRGGGV